MMQDVETRLSDAQQPVMHDIRLEILPHEIACDHPASMSERAVQGSHPL